MMFFGGPWMIIFWVAIVALVVWGGITLTKRGNSAPGNAPKHDPLDSAKVRYAKGEISKEEFEQIKKALH